MPTTADEIIALLKLEPLPHEGGFFRQTYVSAQTLPGGRTAGTAIYFLITPDDFSALHLLKTDEVWHFYAGDPVEHITLDDRSGDGEKNLLGTDFAAGQRPQLSVPGNCWQGARLAPGRRVHGWTLLGCTMAPGWLADECSMAVRDTLLKRFPVWADPVRALTR